MSVLQRHKNWWNEVLWKPKKAHSLEQLKLVDPKIIEVIEFKRTGFSIKYCSETLWSLSIIGNCWLKHFVQLPKSSSGVTRMTRECLSECVSVFVCVCVSVILCGV